MLKKVNRNVCQTSIHFSNAYVKKDVRTQCLIPELIN